MRLAVLGLSIALAACAGGQDYLIAGSGGFDGGGSDDTVVFTDETAPIGDVLVSDGNARLPFRNGANGPLVVALSPFNDGSGTLPTPSLAAIGGGTPVSGALSGVAGTLAGTGAVSGVVSTAGSAVTTAGSSAASLGNTVAALTGTGAGGLTNVQSGVNAAPSLTATIPSIKTPSGGTPSLSLNAGAAIDAGTHVSSFLPSPVTSASPLNASGLPALNGVTSLPANLPIRLGR